MSVFGATALYLTSLNASGVYGEEVGLLFNAGVVASLIAFVYLAFQIDAHLLRSVSDQTLGELRTYFFRGKGVFSLHLFFIPLHILIAILVVVVLSFDRTLLLLSGVLSFELGAVLQFRSVEMVSRLSDKRWGEPDEKIVPAVYLALEVVFGATVLYWMHSLPDLSVNPLVFYFNNDYSLIPFLLVYGYLLPVTLFAVAAGGIILHLIVDELLERVRGLYG